MVVRHGACSRSRHGSEALPFRRLGAREFAQFLRYAYASAAETAEWLDDGVTRKHWKEDDVVTAKRILGRLNPPLLALIRYLRTPEAQARGRILKSDTNPRK
jgi:hypothetical protein